VLLIKYYSGDKIEKNEMGWACSTYRGRTGAYRALGGNLRERRHLENLKGRWEDNIKMDFQEEGLEHGLN